MGGCISSCIQVFQEYVVTVVCRYETLDREPHPIGEQSGGDVSEITTRHANNQLVRFSQLVQLSVSVEIVERLGQETGYVDGVREVSFI